MGSLDLLPSNPTYLLLDDSSRFREHLRIPFLILSLQVLKNVLMDEPQLFLFPRIGRKIKKMFRLIHFEILPLSHACGVVDSIAPEDGPVERDPRSRAHTH